MISKVIRCPKCKCGYFKDPFGKNMKLDDCQSVTCTNCSTAYVARKTKKMFVTSIHPFEKNGLLKSIESIRERRKESYSEAQKECREMIRKRKDWLKAKQSEYYGRGETFDVSKMRRGEGEPLKSFERRCKLSEDEGRFISLREYNEAYKIGENPPSPAINSSTMIRQPFECKEAFHKRCKLSEKLGRYLSTTDYEDIITKERAESIKNANEKRAETNKQKVLDIAKSEGYIIPNELVEKFDIMEKKFKRYGKRLAAHEQRLNQHAKTINDNFELVEKTEKEVDKRIDELQKSVVDLKHSKEQPDSSNTAAVSAEFFAYGVPEKDSLYSELISKARKYRETEAKFDEHVKRTYQEMKEFLIIYKRMGREISYIRFSPNCKIENRDRAIKDREERNNKAKSNYADAKARYDFYRGERDYARDKANEYERLAANRAGYLKSLLHTYAITTNDGINFTENLTDKVNNSLDEVQLKDMISGAPFIILNSAIEFLNDTIIKTGKEQFGIILELMYGNVVKKDVSTLTNRLKQLDHDLADAELNKEILQKEVDKRNVYPIPLPTFVKDTDANKVNNALDKEQLKDAVRNTDVRTLTDTAEQLNAFISKYEAERQSLGLDLSFFNQKPARTEKDEAELRERITQLDEGIKNAKECRKHILDEIYKLESHAVFTACDAIKPIKTSDFNIYGSCTKRWKSSDTESKCDKNKEQESKHGLWATIKRILTDRPA